MLIDSYREAFYRVSVKAIIKNSEGQVLLVKEGGDNWDLPGGGIDHGEDASTAMRRELWEEISVKEVLSMDMKTVVTFEVAESERYGLWIVYDVTVGDSEFAMGHDVRAMEFMDAALLTEDTRSHKIIREAIFGTSA